MLSRPDAARAGFQASARFASGPPGGRQAGTWRARDGRVQVSRGAVQYASHSAAGVTLAARDTGRWIVEWVAPDSAGAPVAFHLSANAANYDASEFGDFIYTWAAEVPAERQH